MLPSIHIFVLKDNNVIIHISGYVHDNIVKDVDWYGERVLGEVSLGGIIILVVIRTIQHNMLKVNIINIYYVLLNKCKTDLYFLTFPADF